MRRSAPRFRIALMGAVVMIVAAAMPFVAAYVQNDLAVNRKLELLAPRLPARTTELNVGLEVGSAASGCRGVAARTLATELPPDRLAEELRRLDSTQAAALAWSDRSGFWRRSVQPSAPAERVPEHDHEQLPQSVRKLLVQWTILPPGVRRVVLFSTFPVDGITDPRCS